MNLGEYIIKNFTLSAEAFLSVSLLQLTFLATSTAYSRKNKYIVLGGPLYYSTILIIIFTLLLLLNEDLLITNSYIGNNSLINDYLSYIVKITICFFAILYFVLVSADILKKEEPIRNHFEYVILTLISVLGLLILSSANDLITAYLAVELQSIAFYIMAAFKKNSTHSIESGLKYFIIGSLASSFFLFGSAILYGCLGTLNFDDFRMFSSILFQNNTGWHENFTIKEISPSVLATIKILTFKTLEESHYYQICPFHTAYIKTNWIERIITSVMLNPGLEIFANLPIYLHTFLLFMKTDKTPSVLMDYYVENFAVKNDDPIVALELVKSTNPVFSGGFQEFLKNYFIEKENPLEYWFTIFKSYSNVNRLDYTYFAQFDAETVNVFIDKPHNFLSYCNFCLDLAIFDKYFFNNANTLELDSTILLFKKIYSAYSQMDSSFINVYDFVSINTSLLSLGFLFICVSIFIKLAVAPFHYWSLDVYEGSPNKTTTFFAVVPKIGLFVLLTRICYNSFYFVFIEHYQIYFILLSVISIFIGALGGLEQRKIKTLFAYSSLSHTGYLLLSFSTGSIEGIHLMFYYLIIYMLSSLCFWAIYLFLIKKDMYYSNKNNKELGDFVLLKESNPMLALILTLTLFSIAGIPPIVGFLAKIAIFLVVIQSSAYLVALISIILSVISTFYYIRFIKVLYFDNVLIGRLYFPIRTKKSLVIAVLALSLVLLCINPVLIYLLVYKAILLLS